MAVNGLVVVDVGAYYLEPISEMAEFIEGPWRDRLLGFRPRSAVRR